MANDTMIHNAATYNVWYVDASLVSNGDGLAPATAFNALPSSGSMPENALYLIRRTATAVTLSVNATQTTNNLALVGMPLATDECYWQVPAAAISAWGADSGVTYPYAIVERSTDNLVTRSANIDFWLHRVYLRGASALTTGSNVFFHFTGDTRKTSSVSCTHCKFGHASYDLSAAGYNTIVPANRLRCYIDFDFLNSFTMSDCEIQWGANDNRSYGFYGLSRFVTLRNLNIYLVGHSDYNVLFRFGIRSGYNGVQYEQISLSNINVTLMNNGTGSYGTHYPKLIHASRYNMTIVRKVTVTESTSYLGGTAPASIIMSGRFMEFEYLRSFDIQYVNITLTKSGNVYQNRLSEVSNFNNDGDDHATVSTGSAWLLLSGMAAATYVPHNKRTIDHITISLPDTNVVGANNLTETDLLTYANRGYGAAFQCLFTTGNYDGVGNSYNYYDANVSSAAQPIILGSNITVNNYNGRSAQFTGVQLTGGTFKGQVSFDGYSKAYIQSITTALPGYALQCYGYVIVKVDTITCNKSNITYPFVNQPAVMVNENAKVFIGSCNTYTIGDVNSATSYDNGKGVVCQSEGSTGNLVVKTYNSTVKTWNVYRTGGNAVSLKYVQQSASASEFPTMLGETPYTGFRVTPASTGLKYLKMFFAYKNYTPETGGIGYHVRVEANVPSTTTGAYTLVNSSEIGAWVTDASTWNNDSGLTTVACVIPITVETLAPIDVKLAINWYSATGGYLYIDPTPTVTVSA